MKWPEVARKVLGKAILDRDAMSAMLRRCDPDHFPTRYRPVFAAIRESALEGRPVSVDVLADLHPEVKETVCDLVIEEVTGSDQPYWVERLIGCSEEERAKDAVGSIQDLLLKDERPYEAKKAEIRRLFENAMAERGGSSLVSLVDALPQDDPASFGPFTGFAPWDELVGELRPGMLHVLAGRPGRGKSTLAVQMASGLGAPAIIVPLEMGAERTAELAKRQGDLPERVYVLRDPPRKWSSLELDLRWQIEAAKAKLVVIDHLGYLSLPRRRDQTRAEEIGGILRSIRTLMRMTGCSCLLVCQLNRQVEGRRSERPQLSDLRDSGEIEQEADTVAFLWARREQEHRPQAQYCLTLAKSRDGPSGGKLIVFDRPGRRFLPGGLDSGEDRETG